MAVVELDYPLNKSRSHRHTKRVTSTIRAEYTPFSSLVNQFQQPLKRTRVRPRNLLSWGPGIRLPESQELTMESENSGQ